MTTFDRILDIIQTATLVALVSVLVWRHQNKPEPSDIPEKKSDL